MRRTLLLLSASLAAFAQDASVSRGEKLFQTRCSVPYCHGANGMAGRAPKLIGHTFTTREVFDIVANGTNQGMPAFNSQLQADDIGAVVSYVMTLQGSAPQGAPLAATKSTGGEAQPGKALFFDAVRMGGCGRCHELERRGSRVAPDLTAADAQTGLHSISVSRVMTAETAGEPAFPCLLAEKSEKRVRVYDLSSALPVLRTFSPTSVKLKDGSSWNHGEAVSGYSDAELQEIEKYLQSVFKK